MPEAESDPTRTRVLTAFAAALTTADLPAKVIDGAKRALVDWLAAALAGAADPATEKLRAALRSAPSQPVATLIGTEERTSAPYAALVNGYASHALDFDDVFNPPETTIHLGSCVWPTVMAVAEMRELSGAEAIAAYVAGFEVGARVARAAGVSHFESGWQVTGTAGHLASAAAGARALGLTDEQMANALGMAAAQASGIREVYGSDAKALQPGRAAMNGVLNALMAERGMTARDTALDGERGLLSVISRSPSPGFLVDSLGRHWSVLSNGHKLYPNASLLHPTIDAAIELAKDPLFVLDKVAHVSVDMLPFATQVTGLRHPRPGSEARFSASHCVAVALQTGSIGLDSFGASAVEDPEVARLRELVTVRADASVGKRGARVAVTLDDGTTLERVVTANRGTPDNRLSDDELDAKLLSVAVPFVGIAAATECVRVCWELDTAPRAAVVLESLRGQSRMAG